MRLPPEARSRAVGNLPSRGRRAAVAIDRKSTRLNSSHLVISYAVFCLKKKKQDRDRQFLPSGPCQRVRPVTVGSSHAPAPRRLGQAKPETSVRLSDPSALCAATPHAAP